MLAWLLNLGFGASGGNVVTISGGPTSYRKWLPFEFACRLRVLQQGSLNVGNTQQNIANLRTLCIANANGAQTFAKWGVLRAASTNPQTYLLVYPVNVPGFVKPPNT